MTAWRLLIHGGAGDWAARDPAERTAAEAGLRAALQAGAAVLRGGGAALDAVQAAVLALEEDPVFNAGRGATLTRDGTCELDAAIHDGATGRAGALAGITRLRNPVVGARLVLERSGHVLMAGAGAEAFCQGEGAQIVEPGWHRTERAQRQFDRWRTRQSLETLGTVGAVALDVAGRLAAATSTGGVTGKLPGRVGDSPLIGAGTWADAHLAVSCTGHGEAFIRCACASRLAMRVALGGEVAPAARLALAEVGAQGGQGGCIALARDGTWHAPFTTKAMARGWIDAQDSGVAIA